jgi:phosphatidate cytidylyltransferase
MFLKRLLSGLILVLVALALIYWGGYPLLIGLAILSVIAMTEFIGLMNKAGYHPYLLPGLGLGFVCLADAFFGTKLFTPAVTVFIFLSILWSARTQQKNDLLNWMLTFFGGIYCAGLMGYLIQLRQLPQGFEWAMLVVVSVGTADVSAYLVGSAIGKHLLIPEVSPKKTWEGLVAGILACVGMSVGLKFAFRLDLSVPAAVGLGLLMAVVDVLGDLVVSKFKRIAGVKDTGRLIPGHGGLLDRIDGQLASWLFAYYSILLVTTF